VYGYMLANVTADGAIAFAFHKLSLEDLQTVNAGKYPDPLIRWCYEENRQ